MKDIEVFILTRNRVNLLKQSIDSILGQTHKVKLTIVDNASEDTTQEYVDTLMKKTDNVFYYRQLCFVEAYENLRRAQELATADYVMFFHDDDVLHPQYLEAVNKLINKYDDIDLICSLLTTFSDSCEIKFERHNQLKYSLFENKNNFVAHCYSGLVTGKTAISFPSVVYKTENIKNTMVEHEKYGKIADKPFVINSIKDGKCIQLRDRDMFLYRIHKGQDSANISTGPFLNEIINHNKFFKNILDETLSSRLRFDTYSLDWLSFLCSFGRIGDVNNADFMKSVLKEALNCEAICKLTYWLFCGKIPVVRSQVRRWLRKYYKFADKHIKEFSLTM